MGFRRLTASIVKNVGRLKSEGRVHLHAVAEIFGRCAIRLISSELIPSLVQS